MSFRLSCVLLMTGALWGQKFDPRFTDPRIGVLNFRAAGDGMFEFDFKNNYSAHLVFWAWQTTTGGGGRSMACIGLSGKVETIEPGGTRHETDGSTSCRGIRIHHLSAIYSDGTWVGEWSDLEMTVKSLTIHRLVLERWLGSLRGLAHDPDPFTKVVDLMMQLNRLPRELDGVSSATGVPPDWYSHEAINYRAQAYLGYCVRRLYEHMVGLDTRGDPRRRDLKAEKAFLARSDAKQQIADALARETERVEGDIYDWAWVTLLGPKGERIGPAIPPPPPRIRPESKELAPQVQ